MDKSLILERAQAALDNMIRGQVLNREDANQGRTVRDYNARTGKKILSGNWCTGIFMACLLGMYKRTGNPEYLDRAEFAGHYIMSLQNMDHRNKRYYGAFRECIPQSLETLPRDATTAAWCLVWLYEATGNPEYLDRAILFAEWHMEYAMFNNWPHWAVFNDKDNTTYFLHGSFQSGTGLFYHDLFMATKDARYIERGLRPIADRYIKDFILEDGSLVVPRNAMNNGRITDIDFELELSMHNYNDDFGNQMPTIADGPWPQFPSDMMSCTIVAATQARGSVLFFEKMFESRMYFVDRLISMGAQAVVCDPHRVLITGKSNLHAVKMSSPDIRAGMAMVIAAMVARGTSQIHQAEMIYRGYENLAGKLSAIGAKIKALD